MECSGKSQAQFDLPAMNRDWLESHILDRRVVYLNSRTRPIFQRNAMVQSRPICGMRLNRARETGE